MAPSQTHGGNDHAVPQTMRGSSSLAVFSPIVQNGVNEIVTRLAEISTVIGDPSTQRSPDVAHVPDIGELLRAISKLQDNVKGTKVAQDKKIKEVREVVTKDVKKDITKMVEGEINETITDSIAARVKEDMAEWGSKPGVPKLADALKHMLESNNKLLDTGNIQLENSRSRHANSEIGIPDDLDTPLEKIKHIDGKISELFPATVGELLTYDPVKLTRLLEEYHLRPLEKYNENFNRFLIFIGVNTPVPDQLVNFLEEQPPAYPRGDSAGSRDERIQRSTRRRFSASGKGSNAS